MRKNKVVIGFLGTQLDSGKGAGRWEKWRPTVSLVQHEDVVIERLELLYTPPHRELAHQVRADMATASPETSVNLVPLPIADPWDFGEVYAQLYDWTQAYRFDTEREEYWTHITTGTHVAQICLFLLVESRRIPGVLVQTSPPKRQQMGDPGSYTLINLDLSRYDVIAQRFGAEQQDAVQFLKSGIATRNARFNALIDEVERVAVRSRAPILFTGPTGAGKSHLARRMFELKKARHQVGGEFVEQAMLLKAVEEKRFYPLGSDREVESDFQLVAGTNRDLRTEVAAGRFREDLFARINLWSYVLPGLAQRPEDIEPNVEHLLVRAGEELGRSVRFSNEARAAYLRYAQSPEALWTGNFRDLSASVTRLATLADSGRIGLPLVEAEIARLRWLWQPASDARNGLASATGTVGRDELAALLGDEAVESMDLFDQLQLAAVLQVCRQSRTLSDAGRLLFQASRTQRTVVNDADRLRKYLVRFGLDWDR
eukprot:gene4747-4647_t